MNRQLELRQSLPRAEQTIRLETEPDVPIAVDLGARAVALEGIMAYLNKANQVRGGRIQLRHGGGKLKKQYGEHAHAVQQGAERSRDELRELFHQGIGTLIAEDALRANGMDEADIEVEHISLQAALNRRFGPGRAYATERAKVVAQAKRAAQK